MENSISELSGLNRLDLYERVWVTPVTKLSVEFGVKPQLLSKLCDGLHVPRPSSGYWTQIRMGRRMEKAPLPDLDRESLDEVEAFRQQFFGAHSTVVAATASHHPVITVPDTLKDPHPTIRATQRFLRGTKPDANHVLTPDTTSCLDIRVTRSSLDRALRIIDTFLKHWESLGGSVKLGIKNYHKDPVTQLELEGDCVSISVFEVVRRIATKTKEEPSRWWGYRNYTYEPTGKLVLKLNEYADQRRTQWGDGKKQRLEYILDSFTKGVIALLDFHRERRLDQECVDRQNAAVSVKRRAVEERTKQLEERQEALLESVQAHKQATEIREYLRSLQEKLDDGELQATNPEEFTEWFDWARWHADSIDPLTVTPSRPDFAPKSRNIPVAELDMTLSGRAVVEQLPAKDTNQLYALGSEAVFPFCTHWDKGEWDEICRVLEGLGYDVAGRYRCDRFRHR